MHQTVLSLEGLSSGDFEPAFRELLGERAPLSASTIVRLKQEWEADYAVRRTRPIGGRGPVSRYRSNLIG